MCNITIQIVSKTKTNSSFTDKVLVVTSPSDFVDQLCKLIHSEQSILANRDDVKRMADYLSRGTEHSSKEVFNIIKKELRSLFDVQKLNFNPRTLVYMAKNKCFILQKRSYV